mmetsp:Transcript_1071/g.1797  ORF Transcript_1071/g.1797 Transcript_1071/m.1797 type:complete len:406 (-) Transcript_1071:143-1360(-)
MSVCAYWVDFFDEMALENRTPEMSFLLGSLGGGGGSSTAASSSSSSSPSMFSVIEVADRLSPSSGRFSGMLEKLPSPPSVLLSAFTSSLYPVPFPSQPLPDTFALDLLCGFTLTLLADGSPLPSATSLPSMFGSCFLFLSFTSRLPPLLLNMLVLWLVLLITRSFCILSTFFFCSSAFRSFSFLRSSSLALADSAVSSVFVCIFKNWKCGSASRSFRCFSSLASSIFFSLSIFSSFFFSSCWSSFSTAALEAPLADLASYFMSKFTVSTDPSSASAPSASATSRAVNFSSLMRFTMSETLPLQVSTSILLILRWLSPQPADRMSGVLPSLSMTLTSAPLSISSLTASTLPLMAVTCSSVFMPSILSLTLHRSVLTSFSTAHSALLHKTRFFSGSRSPQLAAEKAS